MKRPRAYNYGTFVMAPKYLRAYARYCRKFVEAYAREGLAIGQFHPQNEPLADQKFPSCRWTGGQMATFIGDYLGPEFRRAGLATEIWLGTLNTDDFDGWPRTVLRHPTARRYVKGVGLQWAGKGMVQRLAEAYPALPLMQTENECGDGQNSWPYAEYVFGLLRHYLTNGVSAYVYWNMILAPGGRSTWGWPQNAMITVDPATGRVTLNPEFYVMKHLTRFVDIRCTQSAFNRSALTATLRNGKNRLKL
jgi:glucosylceramidase